MTFNYDVIHKNVFFTGEAVDASEASTFTVKAHKTKSCYHIEYKLLPEDVEPAKVDIVVFGPAAKVFIEDECKVIMMTCVGVYLMNYL